MNTLKAIYKITTPMFIAGAEKDTAELRPPSFKGAMRFWFRAVALSYAKSWQDVKSKEAKLFGSTDTGQAGFLLKLDSEPGNKLTAVSAGQVWQNGLGSTYLGYGAIGYSKGNNILNRAFIKEGAVFTATLVFKKDIQEEDINLIKQSLIALGLLGGLGSRSRRGFGSVCLEKLLYKEQVIWQAPANKRELQERIREILPAAGLWRELPEYTAFSEHNRISIAKAGPDPLKLLDEIGQEMIRYRSYGRKDKKSGKYAILRGELAEQNFKPDHDCVWAVANGKQANNHPERVAFGLPHNYHFINTKDRNVTVNAERHERRASPLFIHIHQLNNKEFAAVLTLLPARFLPVKEKIKVKNQPFPLNPNLEQYLVIKDFFSRFPDRVEVIKN